MARKVKRTEPGNQDAVELLDLVGKKVKVWPHNRSLALPSGNPLKMRLVRVDFNAGLFVLQNKKRALYISFDNAEIELS